MIDVKISLILLTAPFLLLAAFGELGRDFSLYRQIQDFGISGIATVQSIERAPYVTYPEGGRTLTYELDLPGPAHISGHVHMSDDDATRYSAGQEIDIVYSAHDPSQHALSIWHAWIELINTVIVVAAYGTVLALAFALVRTAPRKSWRDWL